MDYRPGDHLNLPPLTTEAARVFLRGIMRHNNVRGMAVLTEMTSTIHMVRKLLQLDIETLDRMVLVDPTLESFYQDRMLQRHALLAKCDTIINAMSDGSMQAVSDLQEARRQQLQGGVSPVPADPSSGG